MKPLVFFLVAMCLQWTSEAMAGDENVMLWRIQPEMCRLNRYSNFVIDEPSFVLPIRIDILLVTTSLRWLLTRVG